MLNELIDIIKQQEARIKELEDALLANAQSAFNVVKYFNRKL